MASQYHEPASELTATTRDLHRALWSLIEELEAVDWYQQRVDVTADPELREVLAHNRDEEIEHAAMTLEWLRRQLPKFDEELRTYLFRDGPIAHHEQLEAVGASPEHPATADPVSAGRGLGLGKLAKRG